MMFYINKWIVYLQPHAMKYACVNKYNINNNSESGGKTICFKYSNSENKAHVCIYIHTYMLEFMLYICMYIYIFNILV